MADEKKPIDFEVLNLLKHDIKNQLSNIHLALEGLNYELEEIDIDIELYLESIVQSAKKIDDLLSKIE